MIAESELLRRYVESHSEIDFAELVRRNVGLVYYSALRRSSGRRDLAEDITQQVFTVLAQKAHLIIKQESLASWLYTATRFAANQVRRSEGRRKQREQEVYHMNEFPEAAPNVDWERVRPELDGLIDELPDKDRDVIIQRFFHARPFGDIGISIGLNEDSARKRVERALERLRRQLSRRGIKSTTAALASLLSAEGALAAPAGLTQAITTAALVPATAATALTAAQTLSLMTTAKTGYSYLFDMLSLPPERIQKFEDLIAEAAQDRLDLQASLRSQGLARNDPSAIKMNQQLNDTMKAAQLDLLGSDGYQQLLQFQRAAPLTYFIGEMTDLLSTTSTPLTRAQGDQLLKSLTASSAAYQSGNQASMLNIDWQRTINESQSYLSVNQLETLKARAQMMQVRAMKESFLKNSALAK